MMRGRRRRGWRWISTGSGGRSWRADLGDLAHVRPTVETAVSPRDDGDVYLIGRMRAEVEGETDGAALGDV